MLRSLLTAAYQSPSRPATHSVVQTHPPITTRGAMPSLSEPPRHLLPELGRKLFGHTGSPKQLPRNGSITPAHADLPPFACGLTGTSVEVLEPRRCDVEGTVPSWLEGNLFRNGPGVWDIETKGGQTYSVAHWYALGSLFRASHTTHVTVAATFIVYRCRRFGGLTVMHKFQITAGKVTYRNRHLNREAEHYIQAENQEPGVMLWSDPCGTLLGRAFSLFKQAGASCCITACTAALHVIPDAVLYKHTAKLLWLDTCVGPFMAVAFRWCDMTDELLCCSCQGPVKL